MRQLAVSEEEAGSHENYQGESGDDAQRHKNGLQVVASGDAASEDEIDHRRLVLRSNDNTSRDRNHRIFFGAVGIVSFGHKYQEEAVSEFVSLI